MNELRLNLGEIDERQRIIEVLEENDWNRTQTAKKLSISRSTLWKKMREYFIRKELP